MKVLLGITGETDSLGALRPTVKRAREAGDDLTIAVLERAGATHPPSEVETEARRVADEEGVDAAVRRVEGDPGGRLVEVAESEGFDRIVLGGGEGTPMGKVDLSRVEEYVLLNARTTVTIVR